MSTERRMTEQVARHVVREFKGSAMARAWTYIGDKQMIVDTLVMDQIRHAWVADSTHGFSPDEIMDFRKMVITAMAEKGWVVE